jgi:peptide/nickel transport system substrate-binding protein
MDDHPQSVDGDNGLCCWYGQGILSIPLMKEIKNRAPQAICEIVPWNISRTMIVNRAVPPFDDPELWRAMALTLNRQAFIPLGSEACRRICSKPCRAMTPTSRRTGPKARELMQKLGYGPDERLAVSQGHAQGLCRRAYSQR